MMLAACNNVDNPLESIISSTPASPTTTTITLNLEGNIFYNDKMFFLPGDAATSIATITEGAPVTITSSDESVIRIDENGNIVPVGSGTATITITVTENEKYTGATETITIVVGRKVAINEETGTEFVAQDGDQITGTAPNTMHVTIPDGVLVRLNDATIKPTTGDATAAIVCTGDATIILEGVNDVQGKDIFKAGIQVGPENKTLTIDGIGKLTAKSNEGAGIGSSRNETCGDIVVRDGDITASSRYGAAIGAGYSYYNGISKCGNISITGGNITATGEDLGAGIGTGAAHSANCQSLCGDIVITGGKIEVTTLNASNPWIGAAIGTGFSSTNTAKTMCGNIKISGGLITTTTGSNTYGSYSAAIGTSGVSSAGTSQCGDIIIEGGTIIATSINNTDYSGAGIGTGCCSQNESLAKCGDIVISGGTITANGGQNAAGIGTGVVAYDGSCVTFGDITILGGSVTAHTASTSSAGIADIGAGGWWGTGGTRTIGTITLDATNGANYTKVSDTNYKHN